MKIAARVSESKFLVELDESEINKITGSERSGYRGRPYMVGETFDIASIWRYLESILKKKSELSVMARNLRSMADMIESIPVPTEKSIDEQINNEAKVIDDEK